MIVGRSVDVEREVAQQRVASILKEAAGASSKSGRKLDFLEIFRDVCVEFRVRAKFPSVHKDALTLWD